MGTLITWGCFFSINISLNCEYGLETYHLCSEEKTLKDLIQELMQSARILRESREAGS